MNGSRQVHPVTGSHDVDVDMPTRIDAEKAVPRQSSGVNAVGGHDRAVKWASLLGHDLDALKERQPDIAQVVAVTWLGTLVFIAIVVWAFGWGTHWRLWPVFWLAVIVIPVCRLLLNYVMFAVTWDRLRSEWHYYQISLFFILIFSGLIATMWAFVGSRDHFPLARLGSRAYFTALWPIGVCPSMHASATTARSSTPYAPTKGPVPQRTRHQWLATLLLLLLHAMTHSASIKSACDDTFSKLPASNETSPRNCVQMTAGNLAGFYGTPARKVYWGAPLTTVLWVTAFHALRVADPLADTALVAIGLRAAVSGNCPYRGGTSCAAHMTILSFMTVLLVTDFVFASLLSGLITLLELRPEAQGRLAMRLELVSVVCEGVFTLLGGAFVILGMTSSTGLDLLFVIVCAINTAMLAAWMVMALRWRLKCPLGRADMSMLKQTVHCVRAV